MLSVAASITEKVGRLAEYHEIKAKPYLRRNNRIKSIHSSLSIEANSLSLADVRNVIDGRTVYEPEKEIQEVKNAYEAYEMIPDVDPYSADGLKMLHGIMMKGLVSEPGSFRSTNEGVFDGERVIFVAPPLKQVPALIDKLFRWMKKSSEELNPLILSSVFHYEFVFIHPFTDGNGRMARLWQTIILSRWREVFLYLPVENWIKKIRQDTIKLLQKVMPQEDPILSSSSCLKGSMKRLMRYLSRQCQGTGTYLNMSAGCFRLWSTRCHILLKR